MGGLNNSSEVEHLLETDVDKIEENWFIWLIGKLAKLFGGAKLRSIYKKDCVESSIS